MFGDQKFGRRHTGDLLKNWPRLADGSLEKPAFLCHSAGDHYADVITVNMLKSFGIPCVQVNSNDGDFGEIIMGVSVTGADLYVPESMREDAENLLKGDRNDEEF